MLLSKAQQARFWREWLEVKRAAGLDKPEAETARKALLHRAGFESLKEVDALDGFDHVLAELAAILRPSDLAAQVRLANMRRTRALYTIRTFPAAYAQSVASDMYGTSCLDALSLEQLENLRNTLHNRLQKPPLKAA